MRCERIDGSVLLATLLAYALEMHKSLSELGTSKEEKVENASRRQKIFADGFSLFCIVIDTESLSAATPVTC